MTLSLTLSVDKNIILEEDTAIGVVSRFSNNLTTTLSYRAYVLNGVYYNAPYPLKVGSIYDYPILTFETTNIENGDLVVESYLNLNIDLLSFLHYEYIIYGVDLDNATHPIDVNGLQSYYSSLTTASITGNTSDWGVSSSGSNYNVETVDISIIIQEIIDRPGFVAGNSIGLFFESDLAYNLGEINYATMTLVFLKAGDLSESIIDLTSSLPNVASVPSTTTIPINQITSNFVITGVNEGESLISASFGGSDSNQASITVSELVLLLEVSSNSIIEGEISTGTIARSGKEEILPELTGHRACYNNSNSTFINNGAAWGIIYDYAKITFDTTILTHGQTIVEALLDLKITVTSHENYTIYGVNLDDSTHPVDLTELQSSHSSLTTSFVSGNTSTWGIPINTISQVYDIDITTIIQEIIDRPGFVAGNSIGLFFDTDTSEVYGGQLYIADVNIVTKKLIPTDALELNLSSDDTNVVTIPNTVTILENEDSINFSITIVNEGLYNLKGSFVNTDSNIKTITVSPLELTLTFDNSTISDTGSCLATVTRNISNSNMIITLLSSDAGVATVNNSVTILDGDTQASFMISAVSTGTSNITCTYEDVSDTEIITVSEFSLLVSLESTDLIVGNSYTGTVTRIGGGLGPYKIIKFNGHLNCLQLPSNFVNNIVRFGNDFSRQILHFVTSGILQGQIISEAVLNLEVRIFRMFGNRTFTIKGIDLDNFVSPSYIADLDNLYSTLTTASVSSSTSVWGIPTNTLSNITTVDISSIIQEIVNRPGFAEGARIGFFIDWNVQFDLDGEIYEAELEILTTGNSAIDEISVDISSTNNIVSIPSTVTILENETSVSFNLTTIDVGDTDIFSSFIDTNSNNLLLSVFEQVIFNLSLDSTHIAANETTVGNITRSGEKTYIFGLAQKCFGTTGGFFYDGQLSWGTNYIRQRLTFNTITIKQGETIISAKLKLNISISNQQEYKISGVNTNDTTHPINIYELDISYLTKTVDVSFNSSHWDINTNTISDVTTIDISSIIQQIVDRQGFVEGNSIGLFMENDGQSGTLFSSQLEVTVKKDINMEEVTVNVSSSNTAVATVPSTVTIPVNELTESFTINGLSYGQSNLLTSFDNTDSNIEVIKVSSEISLLLSVDELDVIKGDLVNGQLTRSGGGGVSKYLTYGPAIKDSKFISSSIIQNVTNWGYYSQYPKLTFNNIEIAQGQEILNAFIRLNIKITKEQNYVIFGANEDNSSAPVHVTILENSYISKTISIVSGRTSDWGIPLYTTSDVVTVNIKSIIQEIVDRPGFTSGNSIGIFIEGSNDSSNTGYVYDAYLDVEVVSDTTTDLIEVDIINSNNTIIASNSIISILSNETESEFTITALNSGQATLLADYMNSESNLITMNIDNVPLELTLSLSDYFVQQSETVDGSVARTYPHVRDFSTHIRYNIVEPFTSTYYSSSNNAIYLPVNLFDSLLIIFRTSGFDDSSLIKEAYFKSEFIAYDTHQNYTINGIDLDNVIEPYDASDMQNLLSTLTNSSITGSTSDLNLSYSIPKNIAFNIKSIIQEIVDRPGFSEGNNIGILLQGDGDNSGIHLRESSLNIIMGAGVDLVLDLSNSDSGVATIPSTVTILDSENQVDFSVSAIGDGSSEMQASYGTVNSNITSLTVGNALNLILSIDPSSFPEGDTSTGTITRSGSNVEIENTYGFENTFVAFGSEYNYPRITFDSVTIKQNQVVTSAYLTLSVINYAEQNYTIRGVNLDNAPHPTNYSELQSSYSSLTPGVTSSTTDWNIPLYNTNTVNTVDISSVIQQIVNREGFSEGNSIGLFFETDTILNLGIAIFSANLTVKVIDDFSSKEVTINLISSEDFTTIFNRSSRDSAQSGILIPNVSTFDTYRRSIITFDTTFLSKESLGTVLFNFDINFTSYTTYYIYGINVDDISRPNSITEFNELYSQITTNFTTDSSSNYGGVYNESLSASIDVTSLLDEVISRPGFLEGNSIGLFILGSGGFTYTDNHVLSASLKNSSVTETVTILENETDALFSITGLYSGDADVTFNFHELTGTEPIFIEILMHFDSSGNVLLNSKSLYGIKKGTALQLIEGFEIISNAINEILPKYPGSIIQDNGTYYIELNKNDTKYGGKSALFKGVSNPEKDFYLKLPINNKNDFIVCFLIKVSNSIENLLTNNLLLSFNHEDTIQSYLTGNYASNGNVYLKDNSDSDLTSVSTNDMTRGEWKFVEMRYILHETLGSFVLKIDGVEKINSSNIATKSVSQAPDYIDNIKIHFNFGGNGGFLLDDLFIISDTDFIGYKHVEAILPNATGSSTTWTPSSAGSNFDYVNDLDPDGSNYISSTNNGDIDLHNMGDLTRLSHDIIGGQVNIRASSSDGDILKVKYKTDGTVQDGSSNIITNDQVVKDIIDSSVISNRQQVRDIEIGVENSE